MRIGEEGQAVMPLCKYQYFTFELPTKTLDMINHLGKSEKIVFDVLMRSVFSILMHRYLGLECVSLGILIPQYEAVNIKINLSEDPSFLELVERGFTFEEQKYNSAIANISIANDQFPNYFLALQPMVQPLVRLGCFGNDIETAIALCFSDEKYGLNLALAYDDHFYDEWLIVQMTQHLKKIVNEVVANPAMPISKLKILDDVELNQILHKWNDNFIGYEDKCVHELFEIRTIQTPEEIAYFYDDQTITYSELNVRANRLARYLRRKGVQPEVLVGIVMGRSIDACITLLAIMKAGGAYVALNPSYPSLWMKEILDQANLSLLIIDAGISDKIPSGSAEIIEFGKAIREASSEDASNFPSGATPDTIAYISFTSGSTGKPKGVMGIHRSITNGLTHAFFHKDQPNEVCCLWAPLSFGASIFPLLLPLCWGIPVVIIPEGFEKDPVYFAGVIEKRRITCFALVATLFRQLLAQPAQLLKSLRIVALSGEAVTPDLIEEFKTVLPHAMLTVSYSFSELGGVATFNVMQASMLSEYVLLGMPAPNTSVYLLDKAMNPVPPGAIGEIYVSARHLSRGYLGQPDLTTERFLKNPFSEDPELRLYKTGDEARLYPNGRIEILGRKDNQVKIRGFRVSLAEIESAISKFPGVRETAVSTYERSDQQRLAAYIVMKGEQKTNVSEVRGFLQQLLPDYMIPSAFVFLQNMPISANGKLDRAALPLPDETRPTLQNQYESPNSQIEAALVEMWKSVLELQEIGVNDDFLDLGGDSVTAAQIVSRIHEAFDVQIPLIRFFEWLTISDLATEITHCLELNKQF
jgi:amino acid adenylation domain-containing protein